MKYYGLINKYGVLEKISMEELKANIVDLKKDPGVRSITIIDGFGNIINKIK